MGAEAAGGNLGLRSKADTRVYGSGGCQICQAGRSVEAECRRPMTGSGAFPCGLARESVTLAVTSVTFVVTFAVTFVTFGVAFTVTFAISRCDRLSESRGDRQFRATNSTKDVAERAMIAVLPTVGFTVEKERADEPASASRTGEILLCKQGLQWVESGR